MTTATRFGSKFSCGRFLGMKNSEKDEKTRGKKKPQMTSGVLLCQTSLTFIETQQLGVICSFTLSFVTLLRWNNTQVFALLRLCILEPSIHFHPAPALWVHFTILKVGLFDITAASCATEGHMSRAPLKLNQFLKRIAPLNPFLNKCHGGGGLLSILRLINWPACWLIGVWVKPSGPEVDVRGLLPRHYWLQPGSSCVTCHCTAACVCVCVCACMRLHPVIPKWNIE